MSANSAWNCPRCGEDHGLEYARRVSGWERYHFYGDVGDHRLADDSLIRGRWPKTGRCLACGKRVPLPKPFLPDAGAAP
jgi:hypothetical protein